MTIKQIAKFLRQYNVPYLGRDGKGDKSTPFYLNSLSGKKVAIEIAGIIYKQNAGAVCKAVDQHPFIYNDETGWTRPSDDEILDIFKIYFRSYMRKLLESGVIPVVVIEGKGPKMKEDTLKKRAEVKACSESVADNGQKNVDLDTFKKYLRSSFFPSNNHTQIAIDILQELNITTLRAHHEGEGVCAYLVNHIEDPHHCVCAIIDDYDIFMYGCRAVVRNLQSAPQKVGNYEGTAYSFLDILVALDLIKMIDIPDSGDGVVSAPDMTDYNRATKRFRLLCILSGTDYYPNITNIGCIRVWKHIHNGVVQMCTIRDMVGTLVIHKDVLDTYDTATIQYVLSNLNEDERKSPDAISRKLSKYQTEDNMSVTWEYEVVGTHTKEVDSFEDICTLEPRFREIPYYDILGVLRSNMKYNVIHEAV